MSYQPFGYRRLERNFSSFVMSNYVALPPLNAISTSVTPSYWFPASIKTVHFAKIHNETWYSFVYIRLVEHGHGTSH